jgi:hypothetical protein
MAIPSLVQGMIKTEDGKVFKLDSPSVRRGWSRSVPLGLSQAGITSLTQFARNQVFTSMVAEKLQERYVKNILASPQD